MTPTRENLWYYSDKDATPQGPVTRHKLKKLIEEGELSLNSPARRYDKEQWQTVAIAILPPSPDGAIIPPSLPSARIRTSPTPVTRHIPKSSSAQEYRRTCRTCGTVWHSLLEREKKIEKDINQNHLSGAVNCCNPEVTSQTKRNVAAQENEIFRIRQCPQCHSSVYSEEIITHDIPPSA